MDSSSGQGDTPYQITEPNLNEDGQMCQGAKELVWIDTLTLDVKVKLAMEGLPSVQGHLSANLSVAH